MLSPLLFPWPRSGPSTFFILESPLLGTRFGSLEFQIGSLESEKIIIGSLKPEKIGYLESKKSGPCGSIPGT